jgi:hypothetical protein
MILEASLKLFSRVKGKLPIDEEHKGCPSVSMLSHCKKSALRRRVWFRVLSRVERAIVDLTVICLDRVKSDKLAQVLRAIMTKLKSAVENLMDGLVRTVGLPLARRIGEIAITWGNGLAYSWADDYAFARFLAVNFAKKARFEWRS